jgi:hypothetical protein
MCDKCVKSSCWKSDLTRQMTVHARGKPYKCASWNTAFSSQLYLDIHIGEHTHTKPYKCDRCMKSFTQKGTLVSHMRVHTGDRPYTCTICMKSFSRKDTLVEDMIVHTGENCTSVIDVWSILHGRVTWLCIWNLTLTKKYDSCTFSLEELLLNHISVYTGDKIALNYYLVISEYTMVTNCDVCYAPFPRFDWQIICSVWWLYINSFYQKDGLVNTLQWCIYIYSDEKQQYFNACL